MAVGTLDLVAGVAARLDVAGEADVLPAGQAPVAAVLGVGVQTLDRVLEQQRGERAHGLGGQDLVLGIGGRLGEVAARELVQGCYALGVLLLPAGEALAPRDLGDRIERDEEVHQVGPGRVPVAPRAAREDHRRRAVVLQRPQRAEHRVDVAGHVGFAGARPFARVVRGAGGDPRGRVLHDGGLVAGEEAQGACPGRAARGAAR